LLLSWVTFAICDWKRHVKGAVIDDQIDALHGSCKGIGGI
jgi:hypothetical protein